MNRFLFILAIMVAILVVILDSIVSFSGIHQLTKSIEYRHHIGNEIRDLTEYLSSLKDAETGQRGYIITGKEEYLEPYNAALLSLNSDKIKRRLQNEKADPKDTQRINEIESLTGTHLKKLQAGIDLRKEKGFEEAQKSIETFEDKSTMDQLRSIVQSVISDKENQMSESDQIISRNLDILFSIVALSNLVAFSLISMALYSLYRDVKKRLESEQDLNRLNSIQRVVLDSAKQVIISLDHNRNIISFNRSAENLFGYSFNEVINTPALRLFDQVENRQKVEDLSNVYKQPFKNPMDVLVYFCENNIPDDLVWKVKRKNGEKFFLLESMTALNDVNQQIIGFLLVGSDIIDGKNWQNHHIDI